jgi:PKD repeat protein
MADLQQRGIMSTTTRLLIITTAIALAGCTVKKTEAPPLAGPSELSLRLGLQIVPDSILQDGASQAALSIEASLPDGRPARGLALRVQTYVDGFAQDYGMLSAKSVVTGEDGRARVVYTAPPRPAEAIGDGTLVSFEVTPVGNDFQGEVPRRVTLLLVPPGVIRPPNAAPTPAFTFTPTAPNVGQDVVFDASTSSDGGVTCGAPCRYDWDFGDGGTGSGVFVTHRFPRVGLYVVKLTVTDTGGASATISQAVTIGTGTNPTALFTFSPAAPAVSQDIFFNGGGSTAATGKRIIDWDWDFGSGRTANGMTVTKRYDTAGTYTVTLTVTDDAGAKGRATQTVTVGSTGTGPQVVVTVSPVGGTTATNFFFDASASKGPSPIVEYRFTFGDTTPDQVGPLATATHQYTAPGQYVLRVTVRDSAGRTGTTTVNVNVSAPTP